MFPVTRIGDIGVGYCYIHCMPIIFMHITGSPVGRADGIPTTKLIDLNLLACPCTIGINITGSLMNFVDYLPAHRIGDLIIWFGGIGVSLTGSPIVKKF